ncbi:hypothetical protein EC844_101268 [Acinetobacter calcoaceticus]|uniref:Uncharacterized protein n=1 Tax=Acinetobacter calcoaceticus TaxID=471 RepID=A0A4R1Y5J8_ACICA|nr:hypothetical protein EC844_101268 [Acinetobacter calcoaceticus]
MEEIRTVSTEPELDNNPAPLLDSSPEPILDSSPEPRSGDSSKSVGVKNSETLRASEPISSGQASQYIGEYKTVCGRISQIKSFSKGVYLNMGQPYPNQDMTLVIWSSDMSQFRDPNDYVSQQLCASGSIESYKGVAQISLKSASQIDF